MKKIPVTLFVVSALFFILPEKTEAQSLKDILKSETAQKVIDAVKEATALKFEDLQGTWQYKGAACQFKSEELLQKAGGIALGETMEGKLEKAYEKAGIRTGNFSYTFNHDSTFTCQIGKKELKGTYAYDSSNQILTLSHGALNVAKNDRSLVVKSCHSAMREVEVLHDYLLDLFNADRLLKLVTLLSGYSKSSTLSAVNKVAQQYDGMMLGFDLQK